MERTSGGISCSVRESGRHVKMVCDTLKEAGMYENSAIFFLSDHGDFCGDYGLPEKAQNTFEDCLTRVPLLIKPPKGFQTDAGITDSLAELVDFYATVMDFAGVSPKQDHFGRSLRPVLNSRSASVREFVCCEGGRLQGEVQCDEWHAEGEKGLPKKIHIGQGRQCSWIQKLMRKVR